MKHILSKQFLLILSLALIGLSVIFGFGMELNFIATVCAVCGGVAAIASFFIKVAKLNL